jgi:hypothetical protein
VNGGGANATYSFLPWTRRGLANALTGPPAGTALRPTLSVAVEIEGDQGSAQTISQTIHLIGPGDVVGVSPRAIIRQEPRQWAKDFLPNYLPFIEFYDEDFPWRHSPEPPNQQDQLRPWLALVVLAQGEFEDVPAAGPLPAIKVAAADTLFPFWKQLWAWAHVQVNAAIGGTTPLPPADVAAQLEAMVAANPDIACSRLICPRRLEPRKTYHAFLVPAYESGRRAGLGEDLVGVKALDPAWGVGQTRFPVYYRWEFGTAERGDFEYLVGLLKPRLVDPRVGTRLMDISEPGGVVAEPSVAALALEGALRSPQTVSTPWPASYPDPFQKELAGFINLADGIQQASATRDPVITPPFYGRWHALQRQLNPASWGGAYPYNADAQWITELNLDPRHRAAAGLGATVVCDRQEELINQAWWQIGDILEANRRIRLAQLAAAASRSLHTRIASVPTDRLLAITQPVHSQLFGSEETIHFKVKASPLPDAALAPTFRRMVRPRGKIARAALAHVPARASLLARLNSGDISAAPSRTAPAGAATLANLAREVDAGGPSRDRGGLIVTIQNAVIRAGLAGLNGLNAALPSTPAPVARGIAALTARLAPSARQALSEANFTAKAVRALPTSADFRITAPDEIVSFRTGGRDSVEATLFKSALLGLAEQFEVQVQPTRPQLPLDLGRVRVSVTAGIDPAVTIPGRTLATIGLPTRYREQLAETFVPVMAYPRFDRPMYEALRDLSVDNLVPNLNLVPHNTIALLKENRRFIEAYMVGLNHEMGRELLWREYPTDQRGSYFRRFWDVRDSMPPTGTAAAAWAEQTRDIPEIHNWSLRARLGAHPNQPAGPLQDRLVLLMRGALLARFPNVVISAQRAQWQADRKKPRLPAPVATDAERTANQKFPLYSATVAPDVTFLGFDLGVAQAKGGASTDPAADPGWFFVIRQRPGETLFGLDIEDGAASTPLKEWDDLTWEDLASRGLVVDGHLRLPTDSAGTPKVNPTSSLKIYGRDVFWNDASNAAAIAAILYQDPVMVAVHAKEMLP